MLFSPAVLGEKSEARHGNGVLGFGARFCSLLRRGRRGGEREGGAAMAKPVRFEEVGAEVQKVLDANMDEAPARRRAREAFKDVQLGIDHVLFKVIGVVVVVAVVFVMSEHR